MNEETKRTLSRLAGLHGSIAKDVWPNGAKLRCDKCGWEQRPDSATCGRYLAKGWPECCGETMRLERA